MIFSIEMSHFQVHWNKNTFFCLQGKYTKIQIIILTSFFGKIYSRLFFETLEVFKFAHMCRRSSLPKGFFCIFSLIGICILSFGRKNLKFLQLFYLHFFGSFTNVWNFRKVFFFQILFQFDFPHGIYFFLQLSSLVFGVYALYLYFLLSTPLRCFTLNVNNSQ